MISSTSSSSWRLLGAKLLMHAVCLGLAMLAFQQGSVRVLRKAMGPNTASQIDYAFRHLAEEPRMDCVLMGSSRIYRGLNPEKLGGRTFNFAHDGDGFNHVFYKLLYLQRIGKLPPNLVVGIDYFSFATIDPTRRELYRAYFPQQFASDYAAVEPPKERWGQACNDEANAWLDKHFSQVLPLVFQAAASSGGPQRALSENGQYRVAGDPRRPYLRSAFQPFRRNSYRTPMMTGYFERFLALCRQSGVRVALVMPPCNIYEQSAYTCRDKLEFWDYVNGRCGGCQVLSFETDRSFGLRDFIDSTHLKNEAADRFSERLRSRLGWF